MIFFNNLMKANEAWCCQALKKDKDAPQKYHKNDPYNTCNILQVF